MATLLGLTPQQKAALVVVSGLPAPPGVGGVIVQGYDRDAARPPGALVFVDQEGGKVKTFPRLPPRSSARAVRSAAAAYASGRATGVALRSAGVDVDLAPVLDLPDGPLGSRQFRSPSFGVAFARGLAAGGAGACAKHFPGLGLATISTDDALVRITATKRKLSNTRPGSEPAAGSSNAPTPGSTASAASSPAGRNEPTPTSPCSTSPAASSPGAPPTEAAYRNRL
jgi:beta-glucosidase-like glycosyl hydrolase